MSISGIMIENKFRAMNTGYKEKAGRHEIKVIKVKAIRQIKTVICSMIVPPVSNYQSWMIVNNYWYDQLLLTVWDICKTDVSYLLNFISTAFIILCVYLGICHKQTL